VEGADYFPRRDRQVFIHVFNYLDRSCVYSWVRPSSRQAKGDDNRKLSGELGVVRFSSSPRTRVNRYLWFFWTTLHPGHEDDFRAWEAWFYGRVFHDPRNHQTCTVPVFLLSRSQFVPGKTIMLTSKMGVPGGKLAASALSWDCTSVRRRTRVV